MAFTVKKRDSYRWTVQHTVGMRNGDPEVMKFDVELKALGKKRVQDLLDASRDSSLEDEKFLNEVVVDLHDLVSEEGRKYGKADLAELCELFPGLSASIAIAWTHSVLGGGAVRKN